MQREFDKEEFLTALHTIPYWVKNGDDLLKFCKHLQYRLFQEKNINAWYQSNYNITDAQSMEMNKIQCAYDEAYNNDLSEFQPFAEIFS